MKKTINLVKSKKENIYTMVYIASFISILLISMFLNI